MYILELNHGGGELHRYFLLPGREYTIGRKECDILLPLGEPSISRHHATVKVAAMPRYAAMDPKSELEITLVDYSKHGTFVDRERVGKDIARFLYPEDHIRFGMRVTGRVIPLALILAISPTLPDAVLDIVVDAAVQLGAHVVEDRVPSPMEFYDKHVNCLGFLFVSEDRFVMDVSMMESLGYGYTLVTPNYLRSLAADVAANFALSPTAFPAPVSPGPGSLALRSVHYRRPAQTFFEAAEFLSLGKPIASRVFRSYTFLLIEDSIKAGYNRVLEVFGGAVVQVALDNLTLWKHMPTEPTTVVLVGETHFRSLSELVMAAGADREAAAVRTAHDDPVISAYLELYNNHICMIPEENVHLALYRDDQQELNQKPTACYLQRSRDDGGAAVPAASQTEGGEVDSAAAAAGGEPAAPQRSASSSSAAAPASAAAADVKTSPSPPANGSLSRGPSASAAAAAHPSGGSERVSPQSPPSPEPEQRVATRKRPPNRLSADGSAVAHSAGGEKASPASSASRPRHSEGAGSEKVRGASLDNTTAAAPMTTTTTTATAPAVETAPRPSPRSASVTVSESVVEASDSHSARPHAPSDAPAASREEGDGSSPAPAPPLQQPPPSPSAAAPLANHCKEEAAVPAAAAAPHGSHTAPAAAAAAVTAPPPPPQPQPQRSSRLPPKNTVSAAMRAVEAGVSRRPTASEQRRLPISSSPAPSRTAEKSLSPEYRDPYERCGSDAGRRHAVVVHEAAQAAKQSPPRMRVEAVRIGSVRRPSLSQEPTSSARGARPHGARPAPPPPPPPAPLESPAESLRLSAEGEDSAAHDARAGSSSGGGSTLHRGVVRRTTTRRDGAGGPARTAAANGSADFQRSDSSRMREMNAATPMRLTSTRVGSSVPRNRPTAQSQVPVSSSGSALRGRQSPAPREGPSAAGASSQRRTSPYMSSGSRRRRSASNPNAERLVSGTAGTVPGQIPGLRAGSFVHTGVASQAGASEGYAGDAQLGRECTDFMRDFLDGFMTNTERTTRAVLRQTYLDSTSKQYLEDGVSRLQEFLQQIHRMEQDIPAVYSTETTRKSCHEVRQKATYALRKIKGTYDAVHAEVPPCLTKARDALSTRTMSPRRHFRYNSVSTVNDAAYRRQNFRDKDF